MLRRFVVAYLVFVTAAGPALCCCSLPHLAASLAAYPQTPEDLPPCCQPPARGGEGGQCCGPPASPSEGPAHKGDCPGKDGRREGCPCRENGSRPALLGSHDGPDDQPLTAQWLPAAPPAAFDGPVAPTFWAPATPPPPPSARDTLRLLHRLLC